MSWEQVDLWHRSGIDDSSINIYFKKYIFEYIAFVAALHMIYPNYSIGRDGDLVTKLKNDPIKRQLYLRQINNPTNCEIKESWDSIYRELNGRPLRNLTRSNRKFSYWNYSHPREMGRLRNPDDWENMVNYWWAIRNNLVHGGKCLDERRDIRLVERGYITLASMVNFLLEEMRY